MSDSSTDPSPDEPKSEGEPKKRLALWLGIAAAVVVIAAGGGYALGVSSGEDLEQAQALGAREGTIIGTERGTVRGKAVGLKVGKKVGYKQTYKKAYHRAYQKALK